MKKCISIVLALAMVGGLSVANAEDAAPAPAAQPQQKPAQTKTVSIADAIQLSPAQKTAMQKLQQQRAQHSQQMQIKYRELQALSETEKLDKDKVNEIADTMASMIHKFAEDSSIANHDFYSSLTADQKKRMEAIAKQIKQRQQQQQQSNVKK
jgi:Spy/CpxP family protein refolding chaperone